MMRWAMLMMIVAASPAAAQRVSRVDGNSLLTLCKKADVMGCDAYVSGVADALAEMPDQHVACIPPPVKSAQLRDVVVKYLTDKPQDRQKKGAHLTVEALAKAWPCKK